MVTMEPFVIVPLTDCLFMAIEVAPADALAATVNVCSGDDPTVSSEPDGTAAGRAPIAIDVILLPLRSPLSVVVFGVPALAMLGSSGGLSSLLMNPALSVKPPVKSYTPASRKKHGLPPLMLGF